MGWNWAKANVGWIAGDLLLRAVRGRSSFPRGVMEKPSLETLTAKLDKTFEKIFEGVKVFLKDVGTKWSSRSFPEVHLTSHWLILYCHSLALQEAAAGVSHTLPNCVMVSWDLQLRDELKSPRWASHPVLPSSTVWFPYHPEDLSPVHTIAVVGGWSQPYP